jgi:hypothetical protein
VAARVSIPVPPDVYNRKLADLSAGVALEPGHLHVEFSGAEELLGKFSNLPKPPATITTGFAPQ